MPIPGTAVAASTVGLVFLWSAVKGEAVSDVIRELVTGKTPTGTNTHPVDLTAATATAGTGALIAGAASGTILATAASYKGEKYSFGGGHGSTFAPKGTPVDCSGYVSQVLGSLGLMKGTMTTTGLATIGIGIPYAQRAPGDIIVWLNGSVGHCGIIIDGSHFWNNPCTACGGVQISTYPYASRPASAAIIRRVSK